MTPVGKGHFVLVTIVSLTARGTVCAQPTQETKLEVLGVRFEPLQQGKNVVHVEVKNASDQDQVFRTHIQTRSPEYGRSGVGWGTGFFETIPASEAAMTRFVFKIQGPMTESTYIRLTFSNPGTSDGFDEEVWFQRQGWKQYLQQTEYQAGDLKWAEKGVEEDRPVSSEESDAIVAVLRQIQRSISTADCTQAWQRFTRDYQRAEFQSTDGKRFSAAIEPQQPIDAAFYWQKDEFLSLEPSRVVGRNGRLSLLAETQGQTWTLDFVNKDGQWKLDWLTGHTPQFLRWQNWEKYVLPKMEKRSAEHFDIYFSRDSTAERRIEHLVQEKERGYHQICDFLGNDPQMRIRLVLFEDMKTKHWQTGHQGMGWAYGKTIVEVYNETEQLDPYHETVHILMGPVGSPPALFNEGFAVYMSQRLGACALEDLSGGTATIRQRAGELKTAGEWIDLRELITYTEIGSRASRPPIAYAEAASFVEFLIETYAQDRFVQIYKTLKNSDQPQIQEQNIRDLEDICGRSLEQLRDTWETTLLPSRDSETGPH